MAHSNRNLRSRFLKLWLDNLDESLNLLVLRFVLDNLWHVMVTIVVSKLFTTKKSLSHGVYEGVRYDNFNLELCNPWYHRFMNVPPNSQKAPIISSVTWK